MTTDCLNEYTCLNRKYKPQLSLKIVQITITKFLSNNVHLEIQNILDQLNFYASIELVSLLLLHCIFSVLSFWKFLKVVYFVQGVIKIFTRSAFSWKLNRSIMEKQLILIHNQYYFHKSLKYFSENDNVNQYTNCFSIRS